jgi:3',5'-cyclic AMP phosphodiesterase CpdA
MFKRPISRRQFLAAQAATVVAFIFGIKGCKRATSANRLLELVNADENFTVALIADPQVHVKDAKNPVFSTSQRKLTEIVRELNQLDPRLSFVLFDGDMVHSATPQQVENFLERMKPLDAPSIMVHGNHDGSYPYTEFSRMQQAGNGSKEVQFSFDCGRWHFVTFPCNLGTTEYTEAQVLNWLDADLQANQDKPTIVLEHYHLLPQGLTALAWYTYGKTFRRQLVDQLAKYGNVRYVICGHVHNGIQTSVKTAWTYQGMNFITAPTCTASRGFGEEFPQFQAGLPKSDQDLGGGYYLLLDIKGENAQIRGRLVGSKAEFLYPNQFTEYADQEPFWFKEVADHPPTPALVNPSFDEGLKGWMQPYRYITDRDPGFVTQAIAQPTYGSGQSARLFCRAKGQVWAGDELTELYQIVELPASGSPLLSAHYYPEPNLRRGGGYIRICAYRDRQPGLFMMFDWSDGHKPANSSVTSYISDMAWDSSWKKMKPLKHLIKGKRVLRFDLPAAPGQWHQLQVALDTLYDTVVQQPGAFAALGLDRVLIAVGVWSLPDPGAQSGACFDALSFEAQSTPPPPLTIDEQAIAPIDERIFQTNLFTAIQKRKKAKD